MTRSITIKDNQVTLTTILINEFGQRISHERTEDVEAFRKNWEGELERLAKVEEAVAKERAEAKRLLAELPPKKTDK